ncbi:MAG: cellulase family glycosylhydrolase [Vallitaleaceae bacterium]|nr:cellulase family glycosylhydrolase [Vallitaleaceae bacterium]
MKFSIDINNKIEVKPYWKHCVGSPHAYTALRDDYRKQLLQCKKDIGFHYVRFHGILDDLMSTLLMKKSHTGQELGLVYNFNNIDNIIDYLLSIQMKPFIELGFMPTAIASGDKKVFHCHSNITLPKSDKAWEELIEKLVTHLVERYGVEEVKSWFFEVWNEPNLFFFFDGTKTDYFHLYEITAKVIKKIHPKLRVGGPATSCNAWISDFIQYGKEKEVPIDFVSTHHYPTDDPLWKSGMDIKDFFGSELSKDRKYDRAVLTKMCKQVKKEAGEYPVYFTEWNTSAMSDDPKHDESYAAAMIAKTLVDNMNLMEAYSFWTFTDIFEESGQQPGEFHGGFGLQTYHGIPKPAYRVFEMFAQIGNEGYTIMCDEESTTVEAIMTSCDSGYRIIVYNHQIPEEPIEGKEVSFDLSPLKGMKEISIRRIDAEHSNPKKKWQELGSPQYPTTKELELIKNASELEVEKLEYEEELSIYVPEHGVVIIDIHP